MPLGQHPIIKDKYLVPGTHYYNMVTKSAVTRYRVLERFDGYTLVELLPKTGRTHRRACICRTSGILVSATAPMGASRRANMTLPVMGQRSRFSRDRHCMHGG